MNRRTFAKALGAVTALPGMLVGRTEEAEATPSPVLKEGFDPLEWFFENKPWLTNWLVNAQTIRLKEDEIRISYKGNHFFQRFGPYLTIAEMHDDVLFACVFSRKTVTIFDGKRLYTMSGFVEQVGRMPTPEDRVQLYTNGTHMQRHKVASRMGELHHYLYSTRFTIVAYP